LNDSSGDADIIDLANDNSELDDDILDIIESIEYNPEESSIDDPDTGGDILNYDSNDGKTDDDLDDDSTAGIDDRLDDGIFDTDDDYYDDDESAEGNEEGIEGSSGGDGGDDEETASIFSASSIIKDTSKNALGSLVMGALVFVMIALSIMAMRRVNWTGQVRYHPTDIADEQNHELYLDTEMQAPRTLD